ncbi:MAG: DUF1972 domain-containing protein [Steroidobacteraceae bacterium]
MRIAFIGSAGIPNRYGGFESFLEHCGPVFSKLTHSTLVTCDASLYREDRAGDCCGVRRIFVGVKANGVASILHDLLAFLRVYRQSTHILVLGVSGGPWFPFFLLMCRLGGKRLGVNIDGVEWRRTKFSRNKQLVLRVFDYLAQRFSDVVVYDNAGLAPFVRPFARSRAIEIGYPGDHVLRSGGRPKPATALTICRIEPENNLDMLIEGALQSNIEKYTIVGNWKNSKYGRVLRERYQFEPRLSLVDPIYEPHQLADLREGCAIYLHGHSVGGTNPSLVEMLYYDCALICFDVTYNRVTADGSASYFSDSAELSQRIDEVIRGAGSSEVESRRRLRSKYTRSAIAASYIKALMGEMRW